MKTICRTQVMIESIIMIGLACLPTCAESINNSHTSSKIAATLVTPAAIYVNPASGRDVPNADRSETNPLLTIAYTLQQAIPGTIVFNHNGQDEIHNTGVNSVSLPDNQVNVGRVME